MRGPRKPHIRNAVITLAVAAITACGGSDTDGASATTTSTVAAESTTVAPPTTATTSTTTSSTTTTAAPTTTTVSPVEVAQALADGIVLPSGFFGDEWGEERRGSERDFDYLVIDGCAFIDVLVNDDGSIAEAESLKFSQFDTLIEHDVRIYPSVERAAEVVVAWSTQETANCLVSGAEIQAQSELDSGGLEPFTGVAFQWDTYTNHEGEPSFTNIEIENTFTGPDGEQIYFLDIYLIQVGEAVSRLEIGNPDVLWDQTEGLLDVIVERMTSALNG